VASVSVVRIQELAELSLTAKLIQYDIQPPLAIFFFSWKKNMNLRSSVCLSGFIFVEQIVIEYNDLLASQLKGQRQYYESLIVEARSKQESSIAEAVEQIVVNTMQELQNKIEKCEEEKSGITEVRVSLPS
jgi:hypothetical protein